MSTHIRYAWSEFRSFEFVICKIGEEDKQSNRDLDSDHSSYSKESCSERDIVNTVNSDIFVGTSSQVSYTRAINEENIYPSISNSACLNSPYSAECAPDMRSSLGLPPTLISSSEQNILKFQNNRRELLTTVLLDNRVECTASKRKRSHH